MVIFCFVCLVTCFTEGKNLKQVWDLTGRRLFNFEGHEAPVYSICPHQKENIQVSKTTGYTLVYGFWRTRLCNRPFNMPLVVGLFTS